MDNEVKENADTLAKRYALLETERNTFLERARDAALLTLPMLMPPRKWDCNPFVGGYYGRKHNYENKAEDVKENK